MRNEKVEVLDDCFAYNRREKECRALIELQCVKDGKLCPFYITQEQLEHKRE